MTLKEVEAMLDEKATVPLWPQAGEALGLGKGRTYESARAGEIETLRFGAKYVVPTAWLKTKLGL